MTNMLEIRQEHETLCCIMAFSYGPVPMFVFLLVTIALIASYGKNFCPVYGSTIVIPNLHHSRVSVRQRLPRCKMSRTMELKFTAGKIS